MPGLMARSARGRGDLASLDVIVESGKQGFEVERVVLA
jgi:hypothetical protein